MADLARVEDAFRGLDARPLDRQAVGVLIQLAEQRNRGQRLHGRTVAATRHHDIGLRTLIIACPVPDANVLRAVLDCRLHVQVLQMYLFVRNHNVHVVDALQAVISDRQQAVSVGRQVDSDDTRTLIGDHIEEARVLMSEAVVILPPY